MDDEAPPTDGQRSTLAAVLSLAFLFPGATVAGFLAGRWVGEQLGYAQMGAIAGTVLGFAAGLRELVVILDPERRR